MLHHVILKKININLDLISEAHSLLRGEENIEIPGVREEVEEGPHWKITKITIFSDQGAKIMRRAKGEYITIDMPNLLGNNPPGDEETVSRLQREGAALVGEHLRNLLPAGKEPVLLCGLGNPAITADALGPQVVEHSLATRHFFLYMQEYLENGFNNVALCTPNVMGNTGIEALEIIKATAGEIKAKAVIVVDALAAASMARVGNSLQLSNAGLVPGAGLGNMRQGITEEVLKIPVIAIGVPTVVLLTTIMSEAICAAKEKLSPQKATAETYNEDSAADIIKEILVGQNEQFAVTPKDIDEVIKTLSQILSLGIHFALHPKLNINNFHQYLNLQI